MALTQISTAGVKDDAVTSGKIPANAVGSSELADNAVDTAAIADDAVTAAKIADDAVNGSHLADAAINNTAIIADNVVSTNKLTNGTSSNDGKFLRANNGSAPTFETVTGTTINNNADDRVITGSSSANTLNGESNVRIDSSGRLLIGTTTEGHINGDELTIAKDVGAMGMTLRSGNSANCHIYFSDATGGAGEYAGYIAYQHSDNSMHIGTDSSERIHIKSDGKIGIGTSSPANKVHVEDSASGVIVAKQTTNNGGFNTFEGKSSGGTTTFYASHNGRVGASDGIIFGSDTAAANVLDDYEEGTFSPTITGASSNPTQSYANQTGYYTKIGNFCFISVDLTFATSGISGGSGEAHLDNLPFTVANLGNNYGITASVGYSPNWGSLTPTSGYTNPNTTIIKLMGGDRYTGTSFVSSGQVTNATRLIAGFTYRTA